MPRITLSLPDTLKHRLDQHPEINWSERFRNILKEKVKKLKRIE